MTDKFEEFLERLEMPLPEPKLMRVADQAANIQEAYLGIANAIIRYAMHVTQQNE